jgi:hypothetical protein
VLRDEGDELRVALAHAYIETGAAEFESAVRAAGVDTVTVAGDGSVIMSGSLSAVEDAVSALRMSGVAAITQTVLRPRGL